jgi:hypothetical protein
MAFAKRHLMLIEYGRVLGVVEWLSQYVESAPSKYMCDAVANTNFSTTVTKNFSDTMDDDYSDVADGKSRIRLVLPVDGQKYARCTKCYSDHLAHGDCV